MPPVPGLSKILLAVDGSEHSLAATALIADLPLPPECQVIALGVVLPREASYSTKLLAPLEKVKHDFETRGIRVSTETRVGSPAQVLTEYADQQSVDLIVLGAKGLRATLGIFLGGIAQQVVEYSRLPVLVVRAPYTGLQHIMLVTDGSVHSEMALNYLGRLPLSTGAEMTVMHVLPPSPIIEPLHVANSWSPHHNNSTILELSRGNEMLEIEQEEERQGSRLVADTADKIKHILQSKNQVRKITRILERGDAATQIIRYVNQHKVNLVITGSQGLSQVQSWLLGSVSRKLVHYAGCSVMIVR